MNNISDLIKTKRLESGLSQYEFAKLLGYTSKTTINKIEQGKLSMSADKLLLFADKFNIDLKDFIVEKKKVKSKLFDITPEKAGCPSRKLIELIDRFNAYGMNLHGMLFMKGDNVFFETYYKPFNKDSLHRMYSETKSFVGVAIGLLEEDGKISLDDEIWTYFKDKIDHELHPFLKHQTIRDMLMMRTSVRPEYWFTAKDKDRLKIYFDAVPFRPSNLAWEYDSAGSQVLCCLVERVTGMKLLDYLKTKMFDDMGTFKKAFMLQCKEGYTWGDSSMICTLRDISSFGRLVMNFGVYKGKRYINEEYVKTATSKLSGNALTGFNTWDSHGYGYQFWHYEDNVFGLTGMGDQLVICFKDKDVLFSCMSSNQGTSLFRDVLYRETKILVDSMSDVSLPDNPDDLKALEGKCLNQNIRILPYNSKEAPDVSLYDNVKYELGDSNMKISEFKLHFDKEKNEGTFEYINATGHKEIKFGFGHMVYGEFPEEGYNDMEGGKYCPGHFFKCGASAKWEAKKRLQVTVEILDKYFGNLTMYFDFNNDDVQLRMTKNAEYFFYEYWGEAIGKRVKLANIDKSEYREVN